MNKSLASLTAIFLLTTALSSGSARAASPVISDPALTSIGIFTGADPGEGLDLDGNFIYALSLGAEPDFSAKVRDANFLGLIDAEVPGASLVAGNRILNWYVVDYGATPDDDNLEAATSSIRWSAAGSTIPQVILTLQNLEPGAQYKVQLMFGEQCCNRGFDVLFDDILAVKDFNPGVQQGGVANGTQEALITHLYLATKPTMVLRLDGNTASSDYPDHNAIFNAITVEKVSGAADTDNDKLPDGWEMFYFGNLTELGTGDPDKDGISNADEFAAGTNPNKPDTDGDGLSDSAEKSAGTNAANADTDGDGLKDGEEVSTYKTDPLKSDTDGDGLSDSDEVLKYKTDPLKADTDGDGFSDQSEVLAGSDPLNPNIRPDPLTSFGVIKGGDVGEGLDLDGNFVYALAIGADPASFVPAKVRDATFQALVVDEVPGANLLAGNQIVNWYGVNYGNTDNDTNLAAATSSIRWSNYTAADDPANGSTPQVVLTLNNLEVGGEYKVQLMFGEECCNRSWDVLFDDVLVAKDFNAGKVHGGIGNHKQEALITRLYFAKSTTIVIRLDGRNASAASGSDHNAILNAVTVEKLAGKLDTDNDGLPDEWEKLYFGNLNQDAKGDPDNDGLTNAEEFAAGTNPNLADTDGDGLKDGDEIKNKTNPLTVDADGDGLKDGDEITNKTDPLNADTEGDGLSDGLEVLTYKTDPLKADTDGDGIDDGKEVSVGSDPLKTELPTQFTNIVIQAFTGGDPGEGLDLQGNFLYAFNVSSAGAAGKAGDADFTADNAPGIKVTAPNDIPAWDTPEYGDSPADNVIEKVTQSIRFGPTVRVELTNLVAGSTYKLQLLFFEQCCGGRGFNVYGDGVLIAGDFSPPEVQGGINNTAAGAVISADFVTQRDKLIIVLTTYGRTRDDLTDPNAILDGVTLEILKGGTPPPSLRVGTITKDLNAVNITFASVVNTTYVLEFKAALSDPAWQPGAQIKATGTSTTLTDSTAAHLSGAKGFWRIRSQ